MRLLQASKAYWPHIGGVETVVQQLAEGFAESGCESTVLVASETRRASVQVRNGVTVQRVASLGRVLSLPLAPRYRSSLQAAEADVLLVHEPSLLAATALLTGGAQLRRRFDRLIVWWHSDIVRQSALAIAYGPILRQLLKSADRIIAATPHHVTSSSLLGEFVSKIEIVPYGIDPDRYVTDTARRARVRDLRAHWNDEPLILFVGRLARYKGLHRLGSAMDQVPEGHLVAVGSGPCRAELTSSAAYAQGRVTVLPHLGERELGDLMWAADLLVLPSDQPSEAFGLVQLEAMACATPVVTLDLPTGVTWVNRHGETGLVARRDEPSSLATAINTLVADGALRKTLGDQARARVLREFTEKRMVAATLQACSAGPLDGRSVA